MIVLLVLACTGLAFTNIYSQEILLSPLKQVQSGIMPQDVKCNQGLELVINQFNEEPACINASHVTRLLEVGWVTSQTFVSIHSIIPENKTIELVQNQTVSNSTTVSNIIPTNSIPVLSGHGNRTNAIDSIQLPDGISTHTISPSDPPYVKMLSIGMYPNTLKVGDSPSFNATFQNISGKTFYINGGCRATTLFASITPSDHVVEKPRPLLMCADWQKPIKPNETFTTFSHSLSLNGHYQIIQSGTLNVMLEQVITDRITGWKIVETISFNVNATQ